MNLVVGAPWWLILVLTLALCAAAIEDAVRLKISNITSGIIFVGALVATALHGFSPSLWENLLVCVLVLAVGTPLFAAGWLGGGDIKLLAALGTWLDLSAAAGLIAVVFVVGGLLGLVYIAARRLARGARRGPKGYGRIPYGLAIVAGALFVFGVQLSPRSAPRFAVMFETHMTNDTSPAAQIQERQN